VRKIRSTADRLELPVRFSCQLVISACVGCIFDSESDPSWHSGAGKIAHAGHSGQLGSAPKDATIPSSSPRRLLIGAAKLAAKFARATIFGSSSDTRVSVF
jgi:hypothetical protein